MPRPKGSKNKKSIVSSAAIEKKIVAQKESIASLNGELDGIVATIKEQQLLVKAKRSEIRKAEKALAALVAQKEKSEAIESAAAKKAEIAGVVEQLINSGKSAEEILSHLN